MLNDEDKSRMSTAVQQLIEPILEDEGFELVEIQIRGSKRRIFLQIFMDSDDGVTIDDCTRMSRVIFYDLIFGIY